jgi:cytochrome P450
MTVEPTLFVPPFPARPQTIMSTIKAVWTSSEGILGLFPSPAYDVDFYRFHHGRRAVALCNSPALVQAAMNTNNSSLDRKSIEMRSVLRPILGDGLFANDGALWKARRGAVSPVIHASKMGEFAPLMVEAASDWLDQAEETTLGEDVDILRGMAELTSDVISRTIFGCKLGRDRAREVVKSFADYQNAIMIFDPASVLNFPASFPRMRGIRSTLAARRVRNVVRDVIAEAQRSGSASGVSMLQKALSSEGNVRQQEAALLNEAVVIFMAGYETTASTLAWALYLISQVPHVEARFHDEIDQVLQLRSPTLADFDKLVFTRAIIEETLRLYPPVPILSREVVAPVILNGHALNVGDTVMVVPWILHRHRRYWPNPDAFVPERFLPDQPRPDKFLYIPFSIGPRICAGLTFGLVESILVLATLGQRARFGLKVGHRVEALAKLTLRPGKTLPMTLHQRATRPASHEGSRPSSEEPRCPLGHV